MNDFNLGYTRGQLNQINGLIMSLIEDARHLKQSYPELRCGIAGNVGSVLNAYREGDLTFEEAVAMLGMKPELPK